MKFVLLFLISVIVSVAYAEKIPFDDYQRVIDRYMFGLPPDGFDPTKLPSEVSKADQKKLSQEQEKLKSAIHFSVINVTPDGTTAVGFTENTEKGPVHYYLKVGEESNGWKVKEANAPEATMTIVKDNIEVSLKIGGDSAKDAAATKKAGVANASSDAEAQSGNPLRSNFNLRAHRTKNKQRLEYETRIAQAEVEKVKAEAEKAKAEAEKVKAETENAKTSAELNLKFEELRLQRLEKEEKKNNAKSDSQESTSAVNEDLSNENSESSANEGASNDEA